MSEIEQVTEEPERILQLKAHTRSVDQAVRLSGLSNQEQIMLCNLAGALAMQRLIDAGRIAGKPLNRGQRHKIIRAAMDDYESKLRQYGAMDRESDDPVHDPKHED